MSFMITSKEVSDMSKSKTTHLPINPAEMAQFRFALIAPVIHGLFPDASRTAYYKRITEKPLKFPDGSLHELRSTV